MDENVISINPSFSATLSGTNILKPKGRFTLINQDGKNVFNERISIFYVDSKDFHFHLGIADDGIFIQRNNYQCVITPKEITNSTVSAFILTWNTFYLRIIAINKKHVVEKFVETPPCSPPLTLKKWARLQNLIPTTQYNSENDFISAVNDCLQSLKDKLQDSGAETLYDISYQGKRIKSKMPKRETNVHPMIKSLIETEMFLKSIDIVRENVTSSGQIDFTLMGSIKDVGVAKYCIEIKNAHSDDIENGLQNQLPSYIESENAVYGCYCVLYYDHPTKSIRTRNEIVDKLFHQKTISTNPIVRQKINLICIDLSKKPTASKKWTTRKN